MGKGQLMNARLLLNSALIVMILIMGDGIGRGFGRGGIVGETSIEGRRSSSSSWENNKVKEEPEEDDAGDDYYSNDFHRKHGEIPSPGVGH